MHRQLSLPVEKPPSKNKKKKGKRRPLGRPKSGRPVGVPHRARPFHDRHHPAHVTWRIRRDLPSLRAHHLARVVGATFRAATVRHAARRTSFRVIHFSIQSNHIHLIVEAGSKLTLMRGLRGLGIWLARRINERLGRHGQVLGDRYHLRDLTTPRAVRTAIVYVLQNHRHHRRSRYIIDECSSARWFTGWTQPLPAQVTSPPVAAPVTWLARVGWRRYGAIAFDEGPKDG
jgi:REP element-mobilizing transposase RayT